MMGANEKKANESRFSFPFFMVGNLPTISQAESLDFWEVVSFSKKATLKLSLSEN